MLLLGALLYRKVLQFADTQGLPPAKLLELGGLSERDLEVGTPHESLQCFARVLEAANSQIPAFHLRFAQMNCPWDNHAVGFLMRNSSTFGEALEYTIRFQRVLLSAQFFTLHREPNWARVICRFQHPSGKIARIFPEYLFYQISVRFQDITEAPVEIINLRFRHPEDDSSEIVRDMFGFHAEFEAERDELLLPLSALDVPIRTRHDASRKFFEDYVKELMTRAPLGQSMSARVRAWAHQRLEAGPARLDDAASDLAISVRSLQRRLRNEGTSLHRLVDEARRERALKLIEASISPADAARALGYSEPGAFHRAFKRWVGMTPGAYRELRRTT